MRSLQGPRRARADRQRGAYVGREVPVPLPLKGVYADADDAEISGSFAARLENWAPQIGFLEARDQHRVTMAGGSTCRQAFPFEFSGLSQSIRVMASTLAVGSTSIARTYAGRADIGYISAQAIIVGKGAASAAWNGSAWSSPAFTVTTGKPLTDFDRIVVHQDRVFLWDSAGEPEFYYGDIGAVTGALVRFPLGRLGNITGKIVTMESMTVDAGHGMNDTLAIVMSTGQVIIYEGLDPGDPDDWRQTARVRTAPPAGAQGLMAVGGDIWMVTGAGVVSIADALRKGMTSQIADFSKPVARLIGDAVKAGGTWQAIMDAGGRYAILNHVLSGTARQFIFDFETKAWWTATHPAAWFYVLGRETRFLLHNGEEAVIDPAAESTAITMVWHSPWMRLAGASTVLSVTPTILARGNLTVKLTVLSDHEDGPEDIARAEQTVTLRPEDPGGKVALNDLIAVDAVGDVFQIRMEITAAWAKLVKVVAAVR